MDVLGREQLFAIVADAAFRDGVLEDAEKQLLHKLTAFLRLDGALAMELARRSKARFGAGELGTAGRFDGGAVYARCLQVALADGMLEEQEEQLLQAMRGLFKIPAERHEELMNAAREERFGGPPAPPAAPVGPAGAAATKAALEEQAASILASLDEEACRPDPERLTGSSAKTLAPVKFPLRPGGVPIPFLTNMFLAGVAGALMLGGFWLVSGIFGPEDVYSRTRDRHRFMGRLSRSEEQELHRLQRNQRIQGGLFLAVLAGGGLLYWAGRSKVEERLLAGGAAIEVGDRWVALPGFLEGRSEPLRLTPDQVDRILMAVEERGGISSVTFARKGKARVDRFGAGALGAPAKLVEALGARFGVPPVKTEVNLVSDNLETILAGGLFLLLGLVAWAVF
jgi:hypothetical protein